MRGSTTFRPNGLLSTVLKGLTLSAACMALFVAVVMVMPVTGPALWIGVPVALFVGMAAIHRKLPDYSYSIGLVFVPVVGMILALIALQVYWTVLGDSL